MIINKEYFFNPNTINIFTDASVKKLNSGETVACPGCEIVITDEKGNIASIFKDSYIIRNATNNIGELSAIYLGLISLMKIDYSNKKVNLFSDSLLCISSIRSWIFSWINNQYNNIMYGSSGDPVKNQEIIKNIILLIFNNRLYINFYHQKGHVTSTDKSLLNAINVFNTSNGISTSLELMKILSFFNNKVDKDTKDVLDYMHSVGSFNIIEPILNPGIISTLNNVDFDIYKKLINRKE